MASGWLFHPMNLCNNEDLMVHVTVRDVGVW